MDRKPIPAEIFTSVFLKSARRCALCFYLRGDLEEKLGQVAHLDQNAANFVEDNLAFLCFDHHSLFDSKTSQHRNYGMHEVKEHRRMLYAAIQRNEHHQRGAVLVPAAEGGKAIDLRFVNQRRALPESELLKKIWTLPHWRVLIALPNSWMPNSSVWTNVNSLSNLKQLEEKGKTTIL
jgi:hypothetical protein